MTTPRIKDAGTPASGRPGSGSPSATTSPAPTPSASSSAAPTASAAAGIKLAGATGIHKGDREYQQDQVLLLPHPRVRGCVLGVVADGMGGRSGGRKAADQVLMTARQLFERYAPYEDGAVALLRQIGHDAHTVIRLTAISTEQEPHSTIAMFLINPRGDAHCLTSGDSRIYVFRQHSLQYRSRDHSHVQNLVDRGELAEKDADSHPLSNILTSCLGIELEPQFATHSMPNLEVGDVVMACSDGLWHYFSNSELGMVLGSLAPRDAAELLVKKARERAMGAGDNLSLAIAKIEAAQLSL